MYRWISIFTNNDIGFIQWLLKKNESKRAQFFNFTFTFIDDAVSLNNSMLGDYGDRIELAIKDTTYTARYASCFDL